MRQLLLLGILAVSGCGHSTTSGPCPSDFKPEYVIKWPGPPSESSIAIPSGQGGGTEIYTASCTLNRPDGVVIFSVTATNYAPMFLKKVSDKEMLENSLLGFKKHESSRKEVTRGPKKHPGLEVRKQTLGTNHRQLAVMARPVMYDVSATSKEEKLIDLPEVDAFFNSFSIVD